MRKKIKFEAWKMMLQLCLEGKGIEGEEVGRAFEAGTSVCIVTELGQHN